MKKLIVITALFLSSSSICMLATVGCLGYKGKGCLREENRISDGPSFERKHISQTPQGKYMEGYWATSNMRSKDAFQGLYSFPQIHDKRWSGQQAFLDKLGKIEEHAKALGIVKIYWKVPQKPDNRFYTKKHSRIPGDEDKLLQLFEFYDVENNIGWTGDLRPYYIREFNVKPSEQFYNYVMNYPL